MSKQEIAAQIGCHKSSLYREIKRNRCRLGYLPDRAGKMSIERRVKPLKLEGNAELKKYIVEKLQEGWSPEQISGRLKSEKGISVISYETIYGYIYSKQGITDELHIHLKRQHKKRQSKGGRKLKRMVIPNRTSIHDRPSEVNERNNFGDWEGDLVLFSNQRCNLITLRERKSRFLVAIKNQTKEAKTTADNIINKFKGRKIILIATLTLDNGGEFAAHESISKRLQINTFFCGPYSSYQKGTIENGNGVLRYDLPRTTNIQLLSQKKIDQIINKINNRPMKCLGFKTPAEVFEKHYGTLAKGFVALQT
ncbi:MAG: IS30 family transposase ISAeca1 [Legionellaceae bacterium]